MLDFGARLSQFLFFSGFVSLLGSTINYFMGEGSLISGGLETTPFDSLGFESLEAEKTILIYVQTLMNHQYWISNVGVGREGICKSNLID